jgi:predicted nucleotidyltransferase
MKIDDVGTILRALNDANVRYLIVGGLAVVAHGYVRFTQDIDLARYFGAAT